MSGWKNIFDVFVGVPPCGQIRVTLFPHPDVKIYMEIYVKSSTIKRLLVKSPLTN